MALRRAGSCAREASGAREASCAIVLIDPEPVELSNLARQVIYREADLGSPKVEAAARRLADGPGGFAIETHRYALAASNAARLIASCNFVIDATDNPTAKFLINSTGSGSTRTIAHKALGAREAARRSAIAAGTPKPPAPTIKIRPVATRSPWRAFERGLRRAKTKTLFLSDKDEGH